MLFCCVDISKNCPVVQLVKLTTLKAAQKYQTKKQIIELLQEFINWQRRCYIFSLPNIFLHKRYEFTVNILINVSLKNKHFLCQVKKLFLYLKRNTYFAREVYILTLKGESVYRTLQNE